MKINIVYNLDYYLTGQIFETKENNHDGKGNIEKSIATNNKYDTEIYSTKLLQNIKQIRKDLYGEKEDDIDITMIPIAYEKHGLFWSST
jgi:hypothetical protein